MKAFKTLDKSEKAYIIFSIFIRVVLVFAIIISFFEDNWIFVFFSFLTLLLTFFPKIIEKSYKIELPYEFQIVIVLFAYGGVFLGGVGEFYLKYWWWDSLLHFLAGIGLGFAGFLILYVLYKNGRLIASPGMIAVFAFCFGLSLGALWEIFEFLVDSFLGEDMQRSRNLCSYYEKLCDTRLGLMDTMIDLILDAIGSLIAALAGYFYLIKKEVPIFKSLINKFEEKNPSLFKKS